MSDYNFSFCDRNKLYSPAWMSPECKILLEIDNLK